MTEAEHRFLKAIAGRIAPEHIAEVRLFPAMKQGHMQSAVAVVAADVVPEATESPASVGLADAPASDPDAAPPPRETDGAGREASRFSVFTARYRLMLKGPERGKWEFDMQHDADAPLDAVDRVVHGVVRRAGEAGEPQLISSAEFLRAITEPWWAGDSPR